jgi:molybdenum cofactor cytidylyltransferase
MLVFSTTNLAKTMPSNPADNAIMTIGEVANYLKVTERAPGIQVQVPQVPQVQGQPGHPVILDAAVCAQLIAPDAPSLRQWRTRNPQKVRLWEVDNPHYTFDLDTPEDLQALERIERERES